MNTFDITTMLRLKKLDIGVWSETFWEKPMRALIVEDDPTSSKVLKHILTAYGQCDIATDGKEAVEVFRRSLTTGPRYDLICMDIMMPELNGQEALQLIRKTEEESGITAADRVNVFMTTALKETNEVAEALYKGGAAAFFVKPINVDSFTNGLRSIGLI